MFRFKDSNFYLNQVCVPDAICNKDLLDGARVEYDPADRKLNLSADGDYIVLGEHLNRDVVLESSGALVITRDVNLAYTPVRVFRLENLLGVEFVTDQIEAPVNGAYYAPNGNGVLVEGSSEINFLCIDTSANVATLVCVKGRIDAE